MFVLIVSDVWVNHSFVTVLIKKDFIIIKKICFNETQNLNNKNIKNIYFYLLIVVFGVSIYTQPCFISILLRQYPTACHSQYFRLQIKHEDTSR